MKLPAFKLLSKEQDKVNNLPLSGSYLVIGPPGSGKTVVALYRARMIQDQGEHTQLITYSRVLMGYIASGADAEKIQAIAVTYHRWLERQYRDLYRTQPPRASGATNSFKYDWQRIIKQVLEKPPPKGAIPYGIIDEGQDMPAQFYTVARWMTKNLTIFADENQRITEDQCTFDEIRRAANIAADETGTFRLTKNYRNTREIALLAQEFCTGLESDVAELPTRSGPPIVFKHHQAMAQSILQIKRFHELNPSAEIGVLLPTKYLVKKFYHKLLYAIGNDDVVHHYYRNRAKPVGEPVFDVPGINVLTYASAKGLEFDVVFLPELQSMYFSDPTAGDFRMQFYVLISRARERLFMFYTGEKTRMLEHLEIVVRIAAEKAKESADLVPF